MACSPKLRVLRMTKSNEVILLNSPACEAWCISLHRSKPLSLRGIKRKTTSLSLRNTKSSNPLSDPSITTRRFGSGFSLLAVGRGKSSVLGPSCSVVGSATWLIGKTGGRPLRGISVTAFLAAALGKLLWVCCVGTSSRGGKQGQLVTDATMPSEKDGSL